MLQIFLTEVREMTKDLPRRKSLMKLHLDKKKCFNHRLSVGFFLVTDKHWFQRFLSLANDMFIKSESQ